MKISQTTFVTLSAESYLSCVKQDDTASLLLNNLTESIVIQFNPAHLPALKILVAGLEEIENKQHKARMDGLQLQINAISVQS